MKARWRYQCLPISAGHNYFDRQEKRRFNVLTDRIGMTESCEDPEFSNGHLIVNLTADFLATMNLGFCDLLNVELLESYTLLKPIRDGVSGSDGASGQ